MKKVKIIVMGAYADVNTYQRRVIQEANYFERIGCEVEVLILQRKVLGRGIVKNKVDGIKTKHFLCKSYEMERFFCKHKVAKILKPIIYASWLLKFLFWLKRYLKKEENVYLISHNLEMSLLTYIARPKRKSTQVFVMRECFGSESKKRVSNFFIKLISQFLQSKSDWLVQVVPAQFDMTKKKNREKILYIPNYPDIEDYKDVQGTKSDLIRINYIGCVRDRKSLKMLMDAAKGIEGIEIGIHGQGEATEYLKSIEKEYSNVRVTGYYDYGTQTQLLFSSTDVLYCAYDISVPNWKVGYPIKFYEAIITNIPVLLCNGMAPSNMVEEQDIGFVFEYDVQHLKNTLMEICNNQDLLIKKKSNMEKIAMEYTWESVVKTYDKIFVTRAC